jgi:hypothetical protein
MNPQLVAGILPLTGVIIGALLTPLTQLFLERHREQKVANRAKLLVAAELLQAQHILRAASVSKTWPYVEAIDSVLPTAAWREHRSAIAGMVSEELFVKIVMAYTSLEVDRDRIISEQKKSTQSPLTPEIAQSMKEDSETLGDIRRELGIGGGWMDEIEAKIKRIPVLPTRGD